MDKPTILYVTVKTDYNSIDDTHIIYDSSDDHLLSLLNSEINFENLWF